MIHESTHRLLKMAKPAARWIMKPPSELVRGLRPFYRCGDFDEDLEVLPPLLRPGELIDGFLTCRLRGFAQRLRGFISFQCLAQLLGTGGMRIALRGLIMSGDSVKARLIVQR